MLKETNLDIYYLNKGLFMFPLWLMPEFVEKHPLLKESVMLLGGQDQDEVSVIDLAENEQNVRFLGVENGQLKKQYESDDKTLKFEHSGLNFCD